ncbi:glycosyltransferase family 4 protein [Lactonifactor longoviformis]|uniref:glycosyltransferase family 4 protein n=1 Tax=Lactonifactor longoviformis TaxID=341220 RepID=UPI001D02E653|nr:glycosyltransferase family 4 protein [Lactonifactor longoviformis]MCB5712159.1 glycosyltransferase family 4 protein [Lactonifactor longoviformis]MCB5716203.1 glycosyltransferase family 4 protein [Lactonifactor longoviformis]
MPKHYCIFSAQYLPHIGGIERYTYHLAKELLKNGDSVIVITSKTDNLPDYEIMDGIPVYRLPCWNLLNGRYPIIKPKKKFLQLHRHIKNIHFDMIIINARFYVHSLYAAILGKAKHVHTIIIDHGSGHLSVDNPLFDRIGSIYEHCFTSVLKLFCHEFYGVSQASCRWLQHFNIEAKGELYNAIDLPHIEACLADSSIDFREKYNLPEESTVITYTGRLIPEKGVLQLAEAFEQLAPSHPNLYLFIAGEGELEDTLRNFNSSNIKITGRLTFTDIISLLKSSDIFCLPSVSEGFSTSILEAVACHNYIIVSEGGWPKELILDNTYGTILQDTSAQAIYQALVYAAEHPLLRIKASEKTYKILKSNFTWEITVNKLRNLT